MSRRLREEGVKGGWACQAVKATTVDAVQGGEADLVILLMTRNRGRTDFLLDAHRLNVALSRAREAVIILGHADHLCKGNSGDRGQNVFQKLIDLGAEAEALMHLRLSPEEAAPSSVCSLVWAEGEG